MAKKRSQAHVDPVDEGTKRPIELAALRRRILERRNGRLVDGEILDRVRRERDDEIFELR